MQRVTHAAVIVEREICSASVGWRPLVIEGTTSEPARKLSEQCKTVVREE
jgi:hypothetical protein